MSQGLLKSVKTKYKLYKQYLRKPSDNSEMLYKNYRNKLNHSIRLAKRLYDKEQFTKNKSNIKQTWKILKSIMNKSRQRSNPHTVFYHNAKELSDSLEIVNHLCNFFSNIGPNLAKKNSKD